MQKLITILSIFLAVSCQTSGGSTIPTPEPEPQKNEMSITSLSLKEYPGIEAEIDNPSKTIYMTLPYGAVPGKATVIFEVSEGVTASPESGSQVDISKDVYIFLSDEEGNACKYTLKTSVGKSSNANLRSIVNNEYLCAGKISGTDVTVTLPYGADVTSLTFETEVSAEATLSPDLSRPVDLSDPIEIKVTAADGKTFKTYMLSAVTAPQDVAVRGVYLPAPHHSSSFSNYENAKKSISLMADLNFNCLFVCVWAGSRIAWDSEVLMANSTWGSASAANMYSGYTGGTGDALQDMIDLAHDNGIKVIFWFEYGFMHKIGGVDYSDPILAKHPEWIGIGNDGKPSNYNGTDYYLNSYDPEVQEFMLSLMEEALEKYPEVDGIQGDDRLPAMPRNSGYDTKTAAAYKAYSGTLPPADYDNPAWVRWRLDNLNSFAHTMYSRLKEKKDGLCVCFAPNKYPWCEGVLMQEWPAWIRDGVVDLLTVQFYVLPTYASDVSAAMGYVSAASDRNLLNPAMILKNGSRIMDRDVLIEQLQYNRSQGTCGESQFWFDGLYTDYVQDVFRRFYPEKAIFPEF
ncbi:MAG: family 10 glycosylhydrolase [Bacteroidales bacterium]|nr:family 10 glycosylhydrolase [Bacteroidales bacterium]